MLVDLDLGTARDMSQPVDTFPGQAWHMSSPGMAWHGARASHTAGAAHGMSLVGHVSCRASGTTTAADIEH